MSVAASGPGSRDDGPTPELPAVDAGPLGWLPRLWSRQVRLEERLARRLPGGMLPPLGEGLDGLVEIDGPSGRPEVLWRASGLRRTGLVAQLAWPRLATRLALGVETPVAHAMVDRLLGFERLDVEGRLQLTPVEWGVLTFLVAKGLARLRRHEGPLGPWDFVLDRAGPDPFDVAGLGAIVTLRWAVRVGEVAGSVRLWVPESLVGLWLASDPPASSSQPTGRAPGRWGDLAAVWRAEAGEIDMPRGLGRLRVGGVLPLVGSRLRGTPQSPAGPVELVVALAGHDGRVRFAAEPVPYSGGGHLTLTSPAERVVTPREAIAVTPTPDPTRSPADGAPPPTDIPVTLTVELGRLNLTLGRLADLKPGDVVELGRHSREPVELTSGGRLVARGELVQIDTELGVRVTNVFL